jgi:hypothetical protein
MDAMNMIGRKVWIPILTIWFIWVLFVTIEGGDGSAILLYIPSFPSSILSEVIRHYIIGVFNLYNHPELGFWINGMIYFIVGGAWFIMLAMLLKLLYQYGMRLRSHR